MNCVERVVFDTSTLIGAMLRPTSIPRQAFLKAVRQAELCASPATLAELEVVLLRDKFDRYLGREHRLQFLELYRRHARLFAVSDADETEMPCRDPRDNKFLALALACSANAIVSSDDDLQVLNPFREIPILLPRDYLDR
ncbi:MAG TPA: putative toxin-antitoxin system toxin component, PIN family [Zoogloea sp.]|uniref:putative toxin-antitoxin system toxin component, PIN family n=1 Tax=Zoogloea sp. TaxID=49181 RepID=UPI002D1D3EB4|nr:putative toxin-antitoxin system toxin component, PIN family [Zoogloea sp.]HMV18509.1 putative toxin-antitoxin system toxin component, PIN family [Rhodocyclaceae bacterium]HMV64852.1 putative toxin-antitoxin system toxin component, PIN family [Rhodocyclaceae bacterium]HMW53566.1 putative toxin-antitoxin system toxin component, PIN family [Rhodocyclaceae bacterium]HMY50325.1 putative toxin-antitoxin system toxin component, PIN family [Rhodocyclaceae bacterium]HMZ77504.1 putative toxin-antitox